MRIFVAGGTALVGSRLVKHLQLRRDHVVLLTRRPDFAKQMQNCTVVVRTGVVLDPDGGALQKMITPFKMFVGGPIGSGKQYVSWIHHHDLIGLILFAIDNGQVSGPMNATAPGAVTNKQFSKALGR